MSLVFVPLNQSTNKSDMKVCCSKVYQRGRDIQKSSNRLKTLYNCIIQHPQVMQSQIGNYCLKLSIWVQVEPQLVPKLLLQVSVTELHNSIASPLEQDILKEGGKRCIKLYYHQ